MTDALVEAVAREISDYAAYRAMLAARPKQEDKT